MTPDLGSAPTPPPQRDLSDAFGGLKLPPRRRPSHDPAKTTETQPDPEPTPSTTTPTGTGGDDQSGPPAGDPKPAATRRSTSRKKATTKLREKPGSNEPTGEKPAAAPRGRPRQPASAQADQTLTAKRVVYVPDDIRDALAMTCTQTRRTRTQVVLEAISATHTRLAGLVQDDLAPKVVKGELWDEVVYPTRRQQPAKRQVFLTPTIQQLATIDRLVDETGARDRSHLVVVALREHLGTH